MIAVVQRVSRASVSVERREIAAIGRGLLVLLGIARGDTIKQVHWMCEKMVDLRVFPDNEGKMNVSLKDVGGSVLVVSQFTLLGNCRKGRRPSYYNAAPPEEAIPLYKQFIRELETRVSDVQSGEFGAMMEVELINDGPVTLIIEAP